MQALHASPKRCSATKVHAFVFHNFKKKYPLLRIAVMETALSRFVNGWVSVDAHQPEDTCAGSDGRVGEEVTVSMSVSSAANGLFSDCLYAASSNMTECAQTDPPFPIHVTSRFERTTAPNTQAPPEFPSEEISLCLESAKTLDESVADIAAYTNGLVSGVSIAADGLGCTDRSYRLVTVKVTAGTETDVTKCAADASLCPGFPTALPHVAPSKGEICIKKTGTTLTTEEYVYSYHFKKIPQKQYPNRC